MPIREGSDGKLALLCVNNHGEQPQTTMRAYGVTGHLGFDVRLFACKVCGYMEFYDDHVSKKGDKGG